MFEFRRWYKGYVSVRLDGMGTERFINICAGRGILLRGLVNKDGHYVCKISLEDYRRIRPVSRKSGVVPYIVGRSGMPFLMQSIKKHKSLVAGLMLCFIIFFILSKYIWSIEVEGNYRHSSEQLLKYIAQQNITVGTRISAINAPELEADIRQEYPDIGWVSVQIRGTYMKVSIKEINTAYETLGSRENEFEYSHLAAVRDGIVESIVTRTGVPLVKAGDVVQSGQLLVSGVVKVIGDSEEIISCIPVTADADIQLKCIIPFNTKLNRKYVFKEYTGSQKNGYSFFVADKKIFSYNSSIPYAKCDIISEVKNFELFKNFYLPVKYEQFSLLEYNELEKHYTDEELNYLLELRLDRFKQELTESGCTVIDACFNSTINKSALTASGTITVSAPFVKHVEVSDDEWRTILTDEYNGNSD